MFLNKYKETNVARKEIMISFRDSYDINLYFDFSGYRRIHFEKSRLNNSLEYSLNKFASENGLHYRILKEYVIFFEDFSKKENYPAFSQGEISFFTKKIKAIENSIFIGGVKDSFTTDDLENMTPLLDTRQQELLNSSTGLSASQMSQRLQIIFSRIVLKDAFGDLFLACQRINKISKSIYESNIFLGNYRNKELLRIEFPKKEGIDDFSVFLSKDSNNFNLTDTVVIQKTFQEIVKRKYPNMDIDKDIQGHYIDGDEQYLNDEVLAVICEHNGWRFFDRNYGRGGGADYCIKNKSFYLPTNNLGICMSVFRCLPLNMQRFLICSNDLNKMEVDSLDLNKISRWKKNIESELFMRLKINRNGSGNAYEKINNYNGFPFKNLYEDIQFFIFQNIVAFYTGQIAIPIETMRSEKSLYLSNPLTTRIYRKEENGHLSFRVLDPQGAGFQVRKLRRP